MEQANVFVFAIFVVIQNLATIALIVWKSFHFVKIDKIKVMP